MRDREVAGLRALLNEWDRVGVREGGDGPDDEYDCILVGVLGRLQRGVSAYDLATYLQQQLRDHFGIARANRPICWAERLVAWHRSGSTEPGEPA
jgi:hypothetical protein